ncbi:MAG: 30S ribosomal protein S12 methylthiotransferase RimO [Synergistaceae bacterium]|jgi:ribosomal protein S12 methylthiotransferase|nr:30S ribosomal protein S12 methylthiotransferase RimO [Synergistaceae bacterium]
MGEPANKRIFCLSLGCSKNAVDSERIVANLNDAGFLMVSEAASADIVIVNTCGFIRSAVEENIAAILDIIELKNRRNLEKVGVIGCLVARYGEELKRELPEVDFWAGCEDITSILKSLGAISGISSRRSLAPGRSPYVRYLKISEGCNMACSFCAIPSIKGPLLSRPIADLTHEAEVLAEAGAAEICLVAQDLSSYGTDKGARLLIPLLDALESSLPSDIWIRLLYLQPSGVDRALLERVAGGRQVLPYLDMPVQHASPRILGLMNRGGGDIVSIFETARAIRPDFALRTTCMVGFPGETRADFASLLRFVDRVRFDRMGAFEFSPEEGTAAAGLPGQVSKRTKKSRLERLMSLQAEISLSRQSAFVGRELEVLVDVTNGDGSAEGRSFREAPEVDGVIDLTSSEITFRVGEKVRATITEAFEHDLSARVDAKTAVPA